MTENREQKAENRGQRTKDGKQNLLNWDFAMLDVRRSSLETTLSGIKTSCECVSLSQFMSYV
jgi:hypothetical protein